MPKTAEYKQAAHALSEASVALENALTEEQRELLHSYQISNAIAATLVQQEIFKEGFKLGVKFQKEIDDKTAYPITSKQSFLSQDSGRDVTCSALESLE